MPPEPAIADRHAAALDWLLGRINYERTAALPYNERQLKLDRMRQLLTRLGSPDAGQRIVHIAGTKGKGSTAAMVASMLREAGLRVGVYSSPHLERIEERFAVDGKPCSPEVLVDLVDRTRPVVEQMDAETADAETSVGKRSVGGPTFFDITTAMALLLFAERGVDLTVLEVGLGGRLDSTNVCHPVVAAITSIGLDHTKQLGDTLELIAAEKAGIFKPGVPTINGERLAGPQHVIAEAARQHGCRMHQRGEDFDVEPLPEETPNAPPTYRYWSRGGQDVAPLTIGLAGAHQAANAATALAIIDELQRQGVAVSDQQRIKGLASARLPARVEWFAGRPGVAPDVVVDAAHNPSSAAALADAVASRPAGGGRTLVLGLSRDKDGPAIAAALLETAGCFDRFVATRFLDNPRALPSEQVRQLLVEAAANRGVTIEPITADSPAEALRRALDITPPDGCIVATGSFFLAAEVRPLVASLDR